MYITEKKQPTIMVMLTLGEAVDIMLNIESQAEKVQNFTLVNYFNDIQRWVDVFPEEYRKKCWYEATGR